jgi:hypothetical protein
MADGDWEEGQRELFNRYRVSVLQDEKSFLEFGCPRI